MNHPPSNEYDPDPVRIENEPRRVLNVVEDTDSTIAPVSIGLYVTGCHDGT